ncbi:MAG TPA: helix-turn-helix transcriptional regulator [Actinobacteria bacterium]|nr:helix-turn-helix transcriptional regulator [Actinomycetota bacterium]
MTENINKTADFFKALSDPTRIKILKLLLSGKNLCVGMIALQLNITQSAVSQQLKILKATGMVEGTKAGFNMHYRVKEDVFKKYGINISKIL